ncbi:MAG: hypothetical protein U0230_10905 [Polyangiales bacterium]
MNRERMLEMCRRGQWKAEDLDWSVPPRPMSRDEEMAVVQYFVDMSGIELLAGALFEEQAKRVTDPTLKGIFESFVEDEIRHSEVAMRLARYYDVHKYKTYELNPDLVKFKPHFVAAVRYFSAEIANVYITTGELILDVALLRSLNDYVHDTMSERAMDLINRDESRHIAVDFHMTEFYASKQYQDWLAKQPKRSLAAELQAWKAFLLMMYYAKPFLMAVFFEPMDRVDPTGRRIKEAFKRIQLLGQKPEVAARPFSRFMTGVRYVAAHPLLGPLFGQAAVRIAGVPQHLMGDLFTEDEAARAMRMSYDELAEEAIGAKLVA